MQLAESPLSNTGNDVWTEPSMSASGKTYQLLCGITLVCLMVMFGSVRIKSALGAAVLKILKVVR